MSEGSYVETAEFKIGKLENQYFISALATLAQNKELFWEVISKLFDNQNNS